MNYMTRQWPSPEARACHKWLGRRRLGLGRPTRGGHNPETPQRRPPIGALDRAETRERPPIGRPSIGKSGKRPPIGPMSVDIRAIGRRSGNCRPTSGRSAAVLTIVGRHRGDRPPFDRLSADISVKRPPFERLSTDISASRASGGSIAVAGRREGQDFPHPFRRVALGEVVEVVERPPRDPAP